MKKRILAPFFFILVLMLSVGIGCKLFTGGEPAAATDVPSADVQQDLLPTDVPPTDVPPTDVPLPTARPTDAPLPTALPTEEPTQPPLPTESLPAEAEPPVYYIEEFDGDLSNYSYFVFSGVDGGSEMVASDGESLAFTLETLDTWVYFTYDPWIYEDVRIGMEVTNRGVNSQRVSLVCNMTDDGWFEFNIGGDGLYEIYVYDAWDDAFYLIGNGGSTAIQLGKKTNEYIAECIGDTLSLYVNGEYIKSFAVPGDYQWMTEGLVGFAVSSFDVTPVRLNVNWFGIEGP